MRFDEELEQFIFEYYGLIFAWDEEPGEDYMEQVKLFCYRRYLPDKVINDFDFLKLLPVNLFHLTHQNPADKAV